MRRVFVDTNIILDVLLQRDEFWQGIVDEKDALIAELQAQLGKK